MGQIFLLGTILKIEELTGQNAFHTLGTPTQARTARVATLAAVSLPSDIN